MMIFFLAESVRSITNTLMYGLGCVAAIAIFISTFTNRLNIGFDWVNASVSRINLARIVAGFGAIGMLVLALIG